MKKQILISVALIGLVALTGCQDKTTDQWKQEQTAKQMDQIQAISGNYGGSLVSVDGSKTGNMTIDIKPDRALYTGTDTFSVQSQAFVKGSLQILIDGQVPVALNYTGGSYDSNSGALTARTTITRQDGTQEQVQIDGTLTGARFCARLEAVRFPEFGLRFCADRSGRGSVGTTIPPQLNHQVAEDEGNFYAGAGLKGENQGEAILFVSAEMKTAEQELLETLSPLRVRDVTISRGELNVLTFVNTVYDLRTQQMTGTAEYVLTNMTRSIEKLRCQRNADGWTCEVRNNINGLVVSATFKSRGRENP